MSKSKNYESLILVFMVFAVLLGLGFFIYKAFGPKNEKHAKTSSTQTEKTEEKDSPKTISLDELKTKFEKDENFILLDVQSRENYIKKHLPLAINIPREELAERKDELSREKEIIVVGAGEKIDKCLSCHQSAKALISFGFEKILHFREGTAGWEEAGLPLVSGDEASYKNIDAQNLKQKLNDKEDVMIVDLRSEEEYKQNHIKGAVYLSFEGILSKYRELPRNKEIIFYDKTGSRSRLVARELVKLGLIYAENLLEGYKIWQEKGYPLEQN